MLPWVYFLKEDEQLVVEGLTARYTVNGPRIYTSGFLQTVRRRKGYTIGPNEYLHVRDRVTGQLRMETGPKLFFVGPNDEIITKQTALPLKRNQYVKIIDKNTGIIRVERGEKSVILAPTEEMLTEPLDGLNVDEREAVMVRDIETGQLDLITTPQVFIPAPNQVIIGPRKAIPLKRNQYVKIIDNSTGAIRVERGEQSIFLRPTEELLHNPAEGINIDENTAVLVRDIETGQLDLITAPQVFIPEAKQMIEDVRVRIRLADHEVVVIKDRDGKYVIRSGTQNERTFFLDPYSELVSFAWSAGIHKDARTLKITHIDLRPKFMWYEFDVRTQDNVELTIGITFFWQIVDVARMIMTTDDTPGDVCSHARSAIIQAVSQVTLERFLSSFNLIVLEAVLQPSDTFYFERGVKILSVEVRSVTCKDPATQRVLQEIIQETTNRLNRLQKQDGENEVRLRQIQGEIDSEALRGRLLETQRDHSRITALTEGEAEAERIRSFMEGIGDTLSADNKVALYQLLRKKDILAALAEGNAHLYFTPSDVDLSIDTRSA
jgi:regulator of protease activity HflC (stomatin/prohibitin superfamily)